MTFKGAESGLKIELNRERPAEKKDTNKKTLLFILLACITKISAKANKKDASNATYKKQGRFFSGLALIRFDLKFLVFEIASPFVEQ